MEGYIAWFPQHLHIYLVSSAFHPVGLLGSRFFFSHTVFLPFFDHGIFLCFRKAGAKHRRTVGGAVSRRERLEHRWRRRQRREHEPGGYPGVAGGPAAGESFRGEFVDGADSTGGFREEKARWALGPAEAHREGPG